MLQPRGDGDWTVVVGSQMDGSDRLGFTVEDDVTRPHGAVEKGVGKDVDSQDISLKKHNLLRQSQTQRVTGQGWQVVNKGSVLMCYV